jgi:FimV-like protein
MGKTQSLTAKDWKLKAISGLVICSWCFSAHALDLGRFQVLSAIGEPLHAEVDIAQYTPEELRGLRAQLASPASFQQAGMEFNSALYSVATTIETRSNGKPYIALKGRVPLQDTFVDLILETQWATGRLVKNYAVLLTATSGDRNATRSTPEQTASTNYLAVTPATPIAQAVPVPAPVPVAPPAAPAEASAAPPTSVELNAQNIPVYRFAPVDNRTPANSTGDVPQAPAVLGAKPSIASQSDRTAETLTVRPGDTASRLALRNLPSHVSLDQMLLAMVKANPDAFIEGNVNLVRAGAELRMPEPEEAALIPRAEARQTVIAQTRDFATYARRLAQSPLLVGSGQGREMSGKVSTDLKNKEDKSLQQDKLTLSKSQISTTSLEATLAAEREAKDTADQLAALNKNMQELEALSKGNGSALPGSQATADGTDSQSRLAKLGASVLDEFAQNKTMWAWAAGLIFVLLVFIFWIRRKSSANEEVFAPSYDDVPPHAFQTSSESTMRHQDIPPQMSSLDLNLGPAANMAPGPAANMAPGPAAPPQAGQVNIMPMQSSPGMTTQPQPTQPPFQAMPQAIMTPPPQPAPVVQVSAPAPAPRPTPSLEDTEMSKLNLASQLLAKGDQDLARALILSVASSATGDLKARALQLLGQLR